MTCIKIGKVVNVFETNCEHTKIDSLFERTTVY